MMERKPLIAGNWKMHLSVSEAVELASSLAESSKDVNDREVMLAPPFTSLAAVATAVKDSDIHVAGQNVCWEKEGAFTGEISPVMLQEAGAKMVILGHSERRHVFGEDDRLVNMRLRGASFRFFVSAKPWTRGRGKRPLRSWKRNWLKG